MGQPLGRFCGHSNEVIESIEILKGRGATDLRELSLELSAWMFFLGPSARNFRRRPRPRKRNGHFRQALDKFATAFAEGGNPRVIDEPSLLRRRRSRLGS